MSIWMHFRLASCFCDSHHLSMGAIGSPLRLLVTGSVLGSPSSPKGLPPMIYLVSIAALVALFAIATMTPINMGVLAFAAAFVIGGWVSGIAPADIFDFFP